VNPENDEEITVALWRLLSSQASGRSCAKKASDALLRSLGSGLRSKRWQSIAR